MRCAKWGKGTGLVPPARAQKRRVLCAADVLNAVAEVSPSRGGPRLVKDDSAVLIATNQRGRRGRILSALLAREYPSFCGSSPNIWLAGGQSRDVSTRHTGFCDSCGSNAARRGPAPLAQPASSNCGARSVAIDRRAHATACALSEISRCTVARSQQVVQPVQHGCPPTTAPDRLQGKVETSDVLVSATSGQSAEHLRRARI